MTWRSPLISLPDELQILGDQDRDRFFDEIEAELQRPAEREHEDQEEKHAVDDKVVWHKEDGVWRIFRDLPYKFTHPVTFD